ncbi:MAG: hypothetical protein ACXAEN_21350, partial [Candidatus Thorarchaeota archaeon]
MKTFRSLLFGILILLMCTSVGGNTESSNSQMLENPVEPFVVSSYSEHGLIIISNNSDFVTQGWLGAGTYLDPYLIEGLNITTDSTSISIHNTTDYFEINDCLLRSSTGRLGYGIQISNVSNAKVEDCVLNSKYVGIS